MINLNRDNGTTVSVSYCAHGAHVEIAQAGDVTLTLHLSPAECDQFCELLSAASAGSRALADAPPELQGEHLGEA